MAKYGKLKAKIAIYFLLRSAVMNDTSEILTMPLC